MNIHAEMEGRFTSAEGAAQRLDRQSERAYEQYRKLLKRYEWPWRKKVPARHWRRACRWVRDYNRLIEKRGRIY